MKLASLHTNLAYGYEAEDSEESRKGNRTGRVKRRKSKIIKINQADLDKIRRRKINPVKMILSVSGMVLAGFVICLIIFGQSQIIELNHQISKAEQELKEQESIETQLEMKIQERLNLSDVDTYAKEKLKMNKITNAQKELIDLSESDKAEILIESEDNIFDKIKRSIESIWS